jgi:hypothetical protein
MFVKAAGYLVVYLFSIYLFPIFVVAHELSPPGSYSKDINYDSWTTKSSEAQRTAGNRPDVLAANQHFSRKLESAWNLRHLTP